MGWQRAKQILISCLNPTAPAIERRQKLLCHFMLGKLLEKQKSVQFNEALENYLLAEQQLFDHQTDDGSFLIKLEINFRITASIYKYVTRPVNVAIEKSVLSSLLAALKRNKDRIFTNTELDMRPNGTENTDENDNRIGMEQENVVSTAVSGVFRPCLLIDFFVVRFFFLLNTLSGLSFMQRRRSA